MEKAELNRRFGFLLHDLSRLMKRRFDRKSEQVGLTRAQWSVVAHLYREEGVNQATLADRLDIKQMTLARLADRLEGSGWLERRPHPGDRRAKCLYLTDKAHARLEQMRALADEVQEEALRGLPPAQRAQLIELLLQIKGNLITAQNADRVVAQAAPLSLK